MKGESGKLSITIFEILNIIVKVNNNKGERTRTGRCKRHINPPQTSAGARTAVLTTVAEGTDVKSENNYAMVCRKFDLVTTMLECIFNALFAC